MGYTKVFIHFVWATKNRSPFMLTPEIRSKLWAHIKDNAAAKGIMIDAINGFADHCHCLIRMPPEMSISKIMQLIKGESAYWINKSTLINFRFEWQEHYYALSVGQSDLARVRAYINNQENHHTVKSFHDEYKAFLADVGIRVDQRDAPYAGEG